MWCFKMGERKYTKSQLTEYDREILETYDLWRQDGNKFTTIARINRECIDLNTEIEKRISTLETLIDESNLELMSKIKRSLKTTVKRLETHKNRLKEMIDHKNEIEVIE